MLSSDDIDMGSIAFDDGSGDTLGPSRLGLVAVSALWRRKKRNLQKSGVDVNEHQLCHKLFSGYVSSIQLAKLVIDDKTKKY